MIKTDQNSQGLSLKIGDWLLMPSLNRLEREGEVVQLEPKAVAVLELLVRNEGRPVTRQELLEHAWEGVIVSDDALTQVIIKLRKAFDDDSRKPSYIQTIPKRGYRLLAPVEFIGDEYPVESGKKRIFNIGTASLFALVISVIAATWMQLADEERAVIQEEFAPEPMTISVIPFEAIGGTEVSQTFALGITSDLTSDLSKLSALRVLHIPLTNVTVPPSRYLVTGNVQQGGERLKLTVTLVDTESQQQLWSERYDSSLEDIFDMQQSVSSKIVNKLSIKVSTAEKERLAKRYTRNLSAYEDFLKGQAELLHRERVANAKAREWYRLAIEKDPSFARAYAGLALSFAADFRNQWVEDGKAALKQAREMAATAQQIDPSIPEVYWVLGYVDTQYREHDRALASLQKAIKLDSSYADAYALMGGIHTYKGDSKETLPLIREAMRSRPDAGFLYFLLLGRAYFFLGDYEQAIINLDETLERNPESLEAHLYIAATAMASGDVGRAEWEAVEINALSPGFDLEQWFSTYPMTDSKQIEFLASNLQKVVRLSSR